SWRGRFDRFKDAKKVLRRFPGCFKRIFESLNSRIAHNVGDRLHLKRTHCTTCHGEALLHPIQFHGIPSRNTRSRKTGSASDRSTRSTLKSMFADSSASRSAI